MRLTFAALIAVFASLPAFAALQTNHHLTPAAGQHQLSLTPTYTKFESEFVQDNDNTNWTESDSTDLDLDYVYGYSDDHSFGATLSYRSLNTTTGNYVSATNSTTEGSGDASGIRSLAIHYQGKTQLDPVHLYYSAAYVTGLEDPKDDNVALTQPAFILTGGVFKQMESGSVLGLTAKYQLNQDATTTDATDTDHDISGGNALTTTLFYEFASDWHPQVALVHFRTFASSDTPEGATEADEAGPTLYGPRLSMRYVSSETFDIVPSLTYYMLENKDYSGVEADTYDTYNLSVAFRFLM